MSKNRSVEVSEHEAAEVDRATASVADTSLVFVQRFVSP